MKDIVLHSFFYIPMPTIWTFIFYFLIKSKYWKKILLVISFIFLFVPSMPIVSTFIEIFFYEDEYKMSNQNKKPTYVLVFGAGASTEGNFPTVQSLERAKQGVELSKKYSVPIIFSGAEEAKLLGKFSYLKDINVITDVKSRNTYETAKNLKTIIKASDGPILLVTNPIHHRRSILSLKKQNFDLIIPNNYKDNIDSSISVFPSANGILSFNEIIYETLGIIWYYFTGKI